MILVINLLIIKYIMSLFLDDTKTKELKFDDIKKIFSDLTANNTERKGFIVMPSIKGFDFYEIDETILKQFLLFEGQRQQLKEKH